MKTTITIDVEHPAARRRREVRELVQWALDVAANPESTESDQVADAVEGFTFTVMS